MRVAVIYFAYKNKALLQDIARGLAKGIQANGHMVDVVDGVTESDKKLTMYQYLAIGTESTTLFSGKINDQISNFLDNAGAVIGKMSFAYLVKTPFGAEKALLRLMRIMEAQGMMIKNSEIFKNAHMAELMGKQLRI